MIAKFTWKKNIFSDTYSIYENDLQVGSLKGNSFSLTAYGILHGKAYNFKTKGFLRQQTDIVEEATQKVIGTVTLGHFWTKAIIRLHGKEIQWRYENLLNTKWSIYEETGISIKYTSSSTTGQIESNSQNVPLLLAGLFVTDYYLKMSLFVFIILIVAIVR